MNRRKKKVGLPVRTLIAMFAVTLLLGGAIGGTMAWLTSETDEVKNTFTVGDIEIDLYEHKYDPTDEDADENGMTEDEVRDGGNNYKIIPGMTYTKDPVVKVIKGSEECYLFVEYVEANVTVDGVTFLNYTSNLAPNDWTQGTGTSGDGIPETVWYRIVDASEETVSFKLIGDDTITVPEEITKEQIRDAYCKVENGEFVKDADGAYVFDTTKLPTITYQAYAIQTATFADAAAAWAAIPNT